MSINQAFVMVNGEGKIIDSNSVAAFLFGYTEYQLRYLSFEELIPQRFRSGTLELVEISLSSAINTPLTRPFCGLCRDGTEFYAELTLDNIVTAPEKALYIVIHDRDASNTMEKLAESERRYKDLFDATTDIIQSIDTQGHIIYTNRSWCSTLGYSLEKAEGMHVGQVIAPEFHEKFIISLNQVMHGSSIRNVEIDLLCADGSRVMVEGNIIPRWHNGVVVGSHGFFRDVTEKRLQQKQLEALNFKLEAKLETVNAEVRQRAAALDAAMDGVALLNEQGQYTYLNRAHLEMFGYSNPEELLGQSWKSLYREEDIPFFEKVIFPALEKDGYWSGEAIAKRKDGSLIDEDVTLKVVDGVGLICTCRDITTRKKNEHELQAKREELAVAAERQHYAGRIRSTLESVIENTGDELCPTLVKNLCSELETCIAFIARYTDDTKRELKTVALHSEIDFPSELSYFPEGTPCGLALSNQQQPYFEINFESFPNAQILQDKGLTHYLGAPIGQDSDYEGIIVVLNNKSIKNVEFARDMLQLFAARISAEWQSLHRENLLRHSQKMDALGQMAGGIAHDFNNLITVIHGNLSLAKEVVATDSVLAEDMLNDAAEAAARGRALTKQLLDFSHRKNITLTPTPIKQALIEFTAMAERLISANQHFEADINSIPLDVSVTSDKSILQSVLLNLVKNASDAQPEGGSITLKAETQENDVHIQVIDQGTGIDRNAINKIFEPFYTTKSSHQGTGLGLAMAADFIDFCHGKINVQSTPGKGSIFSIVLPISDTGRRIKALEKTHLDLSGMSIVLVDDEQAIVRFLTRLLKSLGATITEFSTADSAWQHLQNQAFPPNIMITDVDMPGQLSGMDLFNNVKERFPDTASIIITGKPDERINSSDLPLLEKPFTRDELLLTLKGVLLDKTPHIV